MLMEPMVVFREPRILRKIFRPAFPQNIRTTAFERAVPFVRLGVS